MVAAAGDFLRPASLRLEHGRTDADAFLDGWLDTGALRREVLEPAGPGGSGRVLPRLWDAVADRAYRADYVALAADGVLVLAGALLLGRGLPFELAVHLRMSGAALARTLDAGQAWTLPAYERYEAEHDPEREADLRGAGRSSGPARGAARLRSAAGSGGVHGGGSWARRELNPHVLSDTRT